LKKAVTIRLQSEIIDYSKAMSLETGIPYQNLINLYLLDCASEGRKLALAWRK
jgi:predicted DNA binding CopG/RHH family protein